jgi:hypothetical protein
LTIGVYTAYLFVDAYRLKMLSWAAPPAVLSLYQVGSTFPIEKTGKNQISTRLGDKNLLYHAFHF